MSITPTFIYNLSKFPTIYHAIQEAAQRGSVREWLRASA